MSNELVFDESAWSRIEQILPDDISVKRVVLEDFMWFMRRNKKYKCNCEKVEDYVRHLQLKANPVFDVKPSETRMFKDLDIEKIYKGLI